MSHTLLSLDISFEKLVKGLEIANASVSETDTNTSTTFVSQFCPFLANIQTSRRTSFLEESSFTLSTGFPHYNAREWRTN